MGKLTLKVPYMSLGRDPVIVEFDAVYILCRPNDETQARNEKSPEELLKEVSMAARATTAQITAMNVHGCSHVLMSSFVIRAIVTGYRSHKISPN